MQKGVFEAGDVVPPRIGEGGNDEISLSTAWFIIRRRWVYLLAGVLVGGLSGVMYATLTAPTYESRAIVQIGKVHEWLIEDVDVLAVQLVEQFGKDSRARALRGVYLKQVSKVPGPNSVLKIVGVGYSPEDTRDFVADIVAKVVERHAQIYASSVNPLQQRLVIVDKQIAILTKQLAELGRLADRFKESQPVQASVIAIQEAQLYTELNQLERDRTTLQRQIARPYSNPSTVVTEATLSSVRAELSKSAIAAIAILLGLGLGLLGVFSVEFFAKLRAATKATARGL